MFPDQDGTGEMLMTAQLFDYLFSDQDGTGKMVMTARLFDCLCIFRAVEFTSGLARNVGKHFKYMMYVQMYGMHYGRYNV